LPALAALLAAIVLGGCGSSGSTDTSSQATTAASGSTSTAAAANSKGGQGSSSSSHVQGKTAKGQANASAKAVPPQVGGRLLRQFTGSGNTRLGTIAVSSPQVMAWSAQHPPIQIFTRHGFILVNSHASSGSVQLSRGSYPGMRVASHGGWTIQLHAGS
jgi:hypothetical protein